MSEQELDKRVETLEQCLIEVVRYLRVGNLHGRLFKLEYPEGKPEQKSAGTKFADAMNEIAEKVQLTMFDARRAAKYLRAALGADCIGDKNIDDLVDDLHKAGLSYQDISNDAEKLAAALRKLKALGDEMGDAK